MTGFAELARRQTAGLDVGNPCHLRSRRKCLGSRASFPVMLREVAAPTPAAAPLSAGHAAQRRKSHGQLLPPVMLREVAAPTSSVTIVTGHRLAPVLLGANAEPAVDDAPRSAKIAS